MRSGRWIPDIARSAMQRTLNQSFAVSTSHRTTGQDLYSLSTQLKGIGRKKKLNCIKRLYPRVFRTKSSFLSHLEQQWTGTSRTTYQHNSRFVTAINYCSYLSPTWDLVREIYVIAIAESIWNPYEGLMDSGVGLMDERIGLYSAKKLQDQQPQSGPSLIAGSSCRRRGPIRRLRDRGRPNSKKPDIFKINSRSQGSNTVEGGLRLFAGHATAKKRPGYSSFACPFVHFVGKGLL